MDEAAVRDGEDEDQDEASATAAAWVEAKARGSEYGYALHRSPLLGRTGAGGHEDGPAGEAGPGA